jgi:hypothetical protein
VRAKGARKAQKAGKKVALLKAFHQEVQSKTLSNKLLNLLVASGTHK